MNKIIVKEVLLFSVPLYNDYKNVYDKDFMEFFLENYENEEIRSSFKYSIIGLNRSIPLNKNTDITLNVAQIEVENINELNSVNYCVIKAGLPYNDEIDDTELDKHYYYFITAYDYNINNGSVTFILEWDSWQNNLKELKTNMIYQKVLRRTRNDIKITQYGSSFVIEPYDGYTISENNFRYRTIKEFNSYKILWEKRILDADSRLKVTDDTTTSGACSIYSPLKVIYRPYCYFDKDFNIYYNPELRINYNEETGAYIPVEFEMSIGRNQPSEAENQLNEHTIAKSYTFNSPFDYYRKSGNFYISSYVELCKNINDEDFKENNYLLAKSNRAPGDKERIYTEKINLFNSKQIDGNISINSLMNYDFDGAFLKYPYVKKSIQITNDKAIETVPSKNTLSFDLIKYRDTQANALYEIKYENIDSRNNYFNIFGEREGLINKDSLTSFFRNSSMSMASNIFLSAIPSLGSFGTSFNPLNVVKSSVSTLSSIYDADKSSDTTVGLSCSFNKLYEVDEPILVTKEIMGAEKYIEYRNVYMYGVPSDEIVNIFNQERLLFDYFEVDNSELTNINMDNIDKSIVSNALNSGIRIWHISKSLDENLNTGVINKIEDIYYMKFNRFNFQKNALEFLT